MLKKIVCLITCLGIFVVYSSAYWFDEGESVYITPSGDCYHQETCGYAATATTEVSYEQAVSMGYHACSWCVGEYNDDWELYGDWLWYNPYIVQWKDEDGILYNDPSDAYSAHGYIYNPDADIWADDNGYLQDGDYHPYPEHMPTYCDACENIIEDRYADHADECPNNPTNKETTSTEEKTNIDTTTESQTSQSTEGIPFHAFGAVLIIPAAIILFKKSRRDR